MLITSLGLEQFRNFNRINLSFEGGINVLVARNGAGKSNVIEAIQLVAMGRSTKTRHHVDIIAQNKTEAYIKASLINSAGQQDIKIYLNKKGKRILINDVPLIKTTELLKGLITVYTSPEDDFIFSGSPFDRRLFLDTLLSKLSPEYLQDLTILKHTIKLLNSYLKQNFKIDKALVSLYHEKIVSHSKRMVLERKKIILELEEAINKYLQGVLGKSERKLIKMIYKVYNEEMKIDTIIDIEIRYRESSFGAHRDDVTISYGDSDTKRSISLGERRLLGVLLRLSEKDLWVKQMKRSPILLLDDAFLGIDEQKQEQLAHLLSQGVQTIITATQSPDHLCLPRGTHYIAL